MLSAEKLFQICRNILKSVKVYAPNVAKEERLKLNDVFRVDETLLHFPPQNTSQAEANFQNSNVNHVGSSMVSVSIAPTKQLFVRITFSETDEDIKTSLANMKQELFVEEESKEIPTDENSSPPSSYDCKS